MTVQYDAYSVPDCPQMTATTCYGYFTTVEQQARWLTMASIIWASNTHMSAQEQR